MADFIENEREVQMNETERSCNVGITWRSSVRRGNLSDSRHQEGHGYMFWIDHLFGGAESLDLPVVRAERNLASRQKMDKVQIEMI